MRPVVIDVAVIAIVAACGIDSDKEIREVTVGPGLVPCVGVGPQTCMVVDGELFYDSIRGFEHESVYEYKLRIERYDRWPDRKEPPADASKYGYRLIEVVEKSKVTQ